MERNVSGVEDEAVLMSVQLVLTSGIIRQLQHYDLARGETGEERRVGW